MKKIILFLLIISLSCSKNDSNNSTSNTNVGKVKKITEIVYYSSFSTQTSSDFNYTNGELSSIVDSGANKKVELTYNGNKISLYKIYLNNQLQNTLTFNYVDNNISEIISDNAKTIYSYLNNKLVSKIEYEFNGTNYNIITQRDYTYNGNNVSIINNMDNFNGMPPSYYKYGYEYDNKNNILKNMNPYLMYIFELESIVPFSENNAINDYKYDSSTSNNRVLAETYSITYNNANLPINIKKYSVNSTGATTFLMSDLTIEYN